MSRAPIEPGLDWLPEGQRTWAIEHRAVLEAIFAAFERNGIWPDPVELDRQLRSQGTKIGVTAAANEMPRSLGERVHYPSSVDLSLFGLGCVAAASSLLDAYVATIWLALARFDDASVPRRLTRADAQQALGLDDHTMDRLSAIVVGRGNFFLGSGDASPGSWDMEIDERVVLYEDVTTREELLARLASERLVNPIMSMEPRVPRAAAAAPPPPATTPGETVDWAALARAASIALGVTANVLALALAPLPLALGALSFTIAFVALHRRIMNPPYSRAAICATVALGLGVGLLTWLIQGIGDHKNHGSRRAALLGRVVPVGEQIDSVLRQAAKDGRRAVFRASVPLHGPGSRSSQVLVLRDPRLKEHPAGEAVTDAHGRYVVPRSDEVRIYDTVDGKLRLAFRFLPQGPGQVRQAPEGDWPGFRFRPSPVTDIDGDGRPEIVGTFERVTLASGPMPAPVLISWDDGTQRYRLAPLIAQHPRLSGSNALDRAQLAGYLKPTILQDRYTSKKVYAYATDHYKIIRDKPDAFLVAAYLDVASMTFSRVRYEIQAWTLDLQSGALETLACLDAPGSLRPTGSDVADDDLVAWLRDHPSPPCQL